MLLGGLGLGRCLANTKLSKFESQLHAFSLFLPFFFSPPFSMSRCLYDSLLISVFLSLCLSLSVCVSVSVPVFLSLFLSFYCFLPSLWDRDLLSIRCPQLFYLVNGDHDIYSLCFHLLSVRITGLYHSIWVCSYGIKALCILGKQCATLSHIQRSRLQFLFWYY